MKKLILLFCFAIAFCQARAQSNKEQQQVKTIILQACESLSLPTRQWFVDVSPAGDIDSGYIKRKLIEKFGIGELEGTGEMLACIMGFLKLAAKEARLDRKMAGQLKGLVLASKEEKLQMEKESIDQGMREARERAERAMDAATTSLVTAIVSGLMQIGFSASKAGQKIVSLAVYIKKLEVQLVILKKKGK